MRILSYFLTGLAWICLFLTFHFESGPWAAASRLGCAVLVAASIGLNYLWRRRILRRLREAHD
jgi:apolipoprotein N-acyltransferase